MSTIRVVNIQHTDATEPNIVLEADGTTVFASGITISGGTNLTVSGTAEFASGTVSAPSITFIDDNNTGIYEPAADTVAITTAATERLRVDSAGNVGIGSSNPNAKLHVSSTAGVEALVSSSGTSGDTVLHLKGNGNAFKFIVPNAASQYGMGIYDVSNSSYRMFIDSSGRVGIGTANPQHALVVGSGTDDALNVDTQSAGGGVVLRSYDDGTTDYEPFGIAAEYINFYTRTGVNSSAERMRIDSSGNVGIGTSTPTGFELFHTTLRLSRTSGVTAHSDISITHASSANYGSLYFDNSASTGAFVFRTNGSSEKVRILGAGGITFNGDTAQANALDDYEEGTWEPALIGTSSNPSVTYHSDTGGFYIKVGRLVYVTGTIRTTAYSGGSGNLLIASIPFGVSDRTNGDNSDGVGTALTNLWNGTSGEHPTLVRSKRNDSAFFIAQNSHDAVSTLLDAGDWGSTCMMTFTLMYYTD